MSTALILVGFTVFVLGLIALIRGRLGWARISTRKTAGLVMAAAFAVLLTGGALSPTPTPTPAATVRHVAPTTTPTPAPTSTRAETTPPSTPPPTTPAPTSQSPVQAAPVQTTTTVALPTTQTVAPTPQTTQAVPAPAIVPRQAAPTPPPAPPAATIAPPAPPPPPAGGGGGSCGPDSYLNSSGVCVPDPVAAPTAPPGATAHCRDGTYSFSQHRSGTCSGHGGVAAFL